MNPRIHLNRHRGKRDPTKNGKSLAGKGGLNHAPFHRPEMLEAVLKVLDR